MLLVVAGFVASCNNSGDAEKRTNDSLDSVKKAKVNMIDSTNDKSIDSVKQTINAQKNMNDSMHKDTANH